MHNWLTWLSCVDFLNFVNGVLNGFMKNVNGFNIEILKFIFCRLTGRKKYEMKGKSTK